jgi:hypothetical protein
VAEQFTYNNQVAGVVIGSADINKRFALLEYMLVEGRRCSLLRRKDHRSKEA